MNDIYSLQRGSAPLLISAPHVGTHIAADQQQRYTARALEVEDTDWFLDRLYGFAVALGATLILPRHSRYLIDLNRPSENTPMYAGQNNTELCPTRHFTGEPLYREGQAPDAAEIARRVAVYWRPYHRALGEEIGRLRAAHGHVVLFDAHSIKSELPWLFEGRLPHLNLGTVGGSSCAPALRERLAAVLASQAAYSHVVDGRFKGGHITRHFGNPAAGVHTVQLEMCWRAYMDETPPYGWHDERAAAVTPLLRALVQAMLDWRPQ
ncbi:N-formylglutamate deformylase [Rubrivivax sp. A210]|uniref:N-formylglutamate deformylase n=1 Tax=Rubrivivax sp. A210 TaxID=2772301 RepID=UPI00191A06EE|nr:N-formylglutamate deformylase [Rubrivivax sp. A210]CAD5372004.1 N-formylglutamate deformylase [Rubrivivax sp. A210]